MIKKLFIAALALTLLASTANAADYYTSSNGCTHQFLDVVGHWAENDICYLYSQGVVSGYSERTYAPNNSITRAEFLKIALAHLGYNVYAVQSASFTDISSGDWYYRYATFARSKGFISGYSDGSFHPNSSITRAEALKMIMTIAGISTYSASGRAPLFTDVSSSDWYFDAVILGADLGIVEGYSNNTFRPNNSITRAEAAVIAQRVWDYLY